VSPVNRLQNGESSSTVTPVLLGTRRFQIWVCASSPDVLALDLDAAVLGDEAAIVLGAVSGVTRQADVLGDEERRAERDHVDIDGHAEHRGDGIAGRSAPPREAFGGERLEADPLIAAGAASSAAAVAALEAQGAAIREQPAALQAQSVVELLRHSRQRVAALVEHLDGGSGVVSLLGEVIVGVAEHAELATHGGVVARHGELLRGERVRLGADALDRRHWIRPRAARRRDGLERGELHALGNPRGTRGASRQRRQEHGAGFGEPPRRPRLYIEHSASSPITIGRSRSV